MQLLEYISEIPRREDLAIATESSPDYLWQIATGRRRASTQLAKSIEEHTRGKVPKWSLRPDVWDAPEPDASQREAA